MEGTFHYMLMANQALVHKKLLAYLKDTGLTIGQPKVLEYLSEHDGSNQTEIARIFSRMLHFLPGVLFGDRREEEPEDIREGGAGFVVAIGREYGSGGREIGRKLADQLGYAFYDDEIIRRAAGTTGYSTKLVEEQEESMTSGVLYDLLAQMYTYAPAQESPKDAVFAAERSIILDVVRKGSCVIVGRCSDWILRDDPHCLRVWIQASEQARIARIMEYDRCDAAAARAIMAKGDRRRAIYYQYYTRRVWGLARNFHLAVDNHARL